MKDKVLLSVKGVSKSFIGVKAVDNVNLEVMEGEVHGVVGENGAGKSTLMNLIFGMLKRDSGSIFFDGQEVNFKGPADALKAGISMIHQESSLVQQFTASENIWLGMEERFMKNGIINNKARDEATQALFDEFKLDTLKYNMMISESSIASCQMVEVIRAVAGNAKLIIMDEPTSSLSEKEVTVLFRIIKQLVEKNVAVIYISHKLDEVLTICDRVSVYRDSKYITTANVGDIDRHQLVSFVVGRELNNLYPKEKSEIGETILEVRNLTKYGKFRNVSFSLHKGEILGFAGLQGAGRSEVAECIFGIEKADEGEILIEGKTVKIKSPATAIHNGLGMVTEDRLRSGIIAQLSVLCNMTLARLEKYCSKGLKVISRKKEIAAVDENIKTLQVKVNSRNQPIDSLSGGNQQKVIIGRWTLSTPKILILDEPTRGIDVGSKSEIHKLMSHFVKQGMSIILISSEMEEVLGMADRIIVMRDGQIVHTCIREEATQEILGSYALG